MIEDLLFFCPVCRQPDTIITKKNTRCSHCGSYFAREGGRIVVNSEIKPGYEWFDLIRDLGFPPPIRHDIPLRAGEMLLFRSQDAALRQFTSRREWRPADYLYADLELPALLGRAQLAVTTQRVFFISKDKMTHFPLESITCVTTDSDTFLIRIKPLPCYQFLFEGESPLKYEIWIRRVLAEFWRKKGSKEIIEYQPRLTFKTRRQVKSFPPVRMEKKQSPRIPAGQNLIYFSLRFLLVLLFRVFVRARVYGKHNLPHKGACIVVLNHEGYWDAYLGQALLPRRVAFLAKNSEFKNRLFRAVLKLVRAIPVRRYQIDPSCLRNGLAWLARDGALGIFLEGERCWDGRFLKPKRGVIKFLLKANVPIVPVRIKGSYECKPRWSHKMQFYPVSLYIGKSFSLETKKTTIDAAGQQVMEILSRLGER